MFWKKKPATKEPPKLKVEKLPGPKQIPGLVGKHLTAEYKMDPDLVPILKAVIRKNPKAEKTFDCRIFDESEAAANEVQIKDYTSLDEYPDLILYEGWFDEESKRVELEEKKKVIYDVPLFTETEIRQKIEGLSEPGSTVFFYQAWGPAWGGPLGRGAAVVELNPNYPGKKGKKYIVYTTNVVDMEPIGKGNKLFDSDKPKDLAKWIKDAHQKRLY
jgi:hypothetical protein